MSEDLPLASGEFLPKEKATAAGAVDDARPDGWGERVIRFIDRPPRLSLLEYLYFAGHDRFGALGVSTLEHDYRPHVVGPLPKLEDSDQIYELIQRVQANEPVPLGLRRLISPGASMGGARPKALLDINGEEWVIKFSDGDPADTPLIEHATMTLAHEAGIRVFNILIDNTDDHEKNHALQHVTEVARVVDGWREHFTQCGVTARDIDLYAQQIDRPFLLDQRRQAAAPSGTETAGE